MAAWEVAATGIAGFLAGGAAGWLARPMAHQKASERGARFERRRKIIDEARAAIYERQTGPVDLNHPLASDPRFLAIRSALSSDVAESFKNPRAIHLSHTHLLADIDRIEKQWGLV